MAYAMQLAKNETVLEIAGAKGENSAVLAFSEAKHIYVNDICKNEIEEFEKIKQSLPLNIGQKLESVHGNCLDLLKLKPELSKKVGLILCRNLIHFFNNQQQAEFFALLKKILKPGGRAIFSVNSIYIKSSNKKIFESFPDTVSFSNTLGTIHDYTQGTQPSEIFYNELSPCPDEHVSTDYVDHYLYERRAGSAWKVNNEQFNKLSKELQPTIQKALSAYKDTMKRVPAGSIRVIMNSYRIYNIKTLPELFKRHGFQVEYTFITSNNGHLVHNQNLFELHVKKTPVNDRPLQMGVIVRYPGIE
jgi:SAM-dependent methyltransferase